MEKIVEFVKSMSRGPCCCFYGAAHGGLTVVQDGRHESFYSQGPRTVHCNRCKAREALEAENIEYVKDETVSHTAFAFNPHAGVAAQPMMGFGTEVFVTTGTFHWQIKP